VKSCIYDNPITFRREEWVDGKLVGFIDAAQIGELINLGGYRFRKLEPFKSGKVWMGDKSAMKKEQA
jgi:hypothetical protein